MISTGIENVMTQLLDDGRLKIFCSAGGKELVYGYANLEEDHIFLQWTHIAMKILFKYERKIIEEYIRAITN